MKRSQTYSGLIAVFLTLLTAILVGMNLAIMGAPSGILWVRYGLLIIATYILVAYLLNWTILLGSTYATKEDGSGRVFALIIGLVLYGWSIHSLFFRHAERL